MISRFYSVSCNLIITSSKVPVIYNTGKIKIVTISPQDSSEAVNSTAFRRDFHLFGLGSRFLSFLPSRCKRSRAVPIMTYSTGTINKLRKVEASRPPKIAVPGLSAQCPAPSPTTKGQNPEKLSSELVASVCRFQRCLGNRKPSFAQLVSKFHN